MGWVGSFSMSQMLFMAACVIYHCFVATPCHRKNTPLILAVTAAMQLFLNASMDVRRAIAPLINLS